MTFREFAMRRLIPAVSISFAMSSVPAAADPRIDFERAADRVEALVRATRDVPGAPPGMAVVMIAAGAPARILVVGTRREGSGQPAGPDTPFYIASMTKAFTGLMAAELDRRGVLALDGTVAEQWPDLKIPGVDTRTLHLRDLLGHRIPFTNEMLVTRTAYTEAVAVAAYPPLLAQFSQAKPAEFQYDNLGYLLYAAALEKRTGRSWKRWLQEIVLSPLGMQHSSARPSALTGVAFGHRWDGSQWHVVEPKKEDLMHAAGGLMVSARDMASWLTAELLRQGGGLAPESFAVGQNARAYPLADRDGRKCDGYAFGWHRCTAFGLGFLEHGGGYTAFRSHMMVAPEAGVAMAVLTNSDSMTGQLSTDLMMAYLKAFAEKEPSISVDVFASDYRDAILRQVKARSKRDALDEADGKWAGWQWKPNAKALQQYVGRYRGPAGEVRVSMEKGALRFRLGKLDLGLLPAVPGRFGARMAPLEKLEAIEIQAVEGALRWNEWQFRRVR